MNFCVAFLILKMEENKWHFWHINIIMYIALLFQERWKHKKNGQCMEKMLWLIEHVKSGLQTFLLEISYWTMPHSQVD